MNRTTTAASRGNQQSIVNASAPKERPILFSGPMVRAILDGRKTQTRRIVKPAPDDWIDQLHGYDLRGRAPYDIEHPETGAVVGYGFQSEDAFYKCPYGQPGDRLWVREAHGLDLANKVYYREGFDPKCGWNGKWRPSIHMTRAASRITLEIVGVRVEQLTSITAGESIKEGITIEDCRRVNGSAVDAYRKLWESINGPGSWNENPWVWVVEFKRV